MPPKRNTVPPSVVGMPAIAPKSKAAQFETWTCPVKELSEHCPEMLSVMLAAVSVKSTETFLIKEGRRVLLRLVVLAGKGDGFGSTEVEVELVKMGS